MSICKTYDYFVTKHHEIKILVGPQCWKCLTRSPFSVTFPAKFLLESHNNDVLTGKYGYRKLTEIGTSLGLPRSGFKGRKQSPQVYFQKSAKSALTSMFHYVSV